MLLDLRMPGPGGLEPLTRLKERDPTLPAIMMNGKAHLNDAVQAIKRGAFQFLEKPLTPDAVRMTIRSALELTRAQAENRALRSQLAPPSVMVGTSAGMEKVRAMIAQVGPTDARVLIMGESGTGKELVAHAIHQASRRANQPFVTVNCAAIPRDLVESEMFGHEKGDAKGYTSMMRYLAGRTDAMRQQFRDEVLSTNGEDFIAFGEALEKVAQSEGVAVIGPQSALEGANIGLKVTKVL